MPASSDRRTRKPLVFRAAFMTAWWLSAGSLAAETPPAASGKDLAFAEDKGNCLACHSMPTVADAVQPGNSGPPFIAMSARFPDRKVLRSVIWDATVKNPNSFMPPFGKHRVLTEAEIDRILDFVHGL